MKLLIVPDVHVCPRYDNDRLTVLGEFIDLERPDHVVCLGDFADMASLSHHDKGSKDFEGRRYLKDRDHTHDALERVIRGAGDGWDFCTATMFLGNHEDRIARAVAHMPELDGTMSVDDLEYAEHGWDVVPFRHQAKIGGVMFSHWFPNGLMGKAIGGEMQARTAVKKHHTSVVAGHSHILGYWREVVLPPTGGQPRVLHGLNAGCYVHPKALRESWCVNTAHMWWRGLVVLDGVRKGTWESMEFVSAEEARRRVS